MLKTLIEALALISTWEVIIVTLLASIYGLVVGSLPGLSATMATALLVPVTFYLSPIAAIAAIVAASSMAIFSGDIPGALLRSHQARRLLLRHVVRRIGHLEWREDVLAEIIF